VTDGFYHVDSAAFTARARSMRRAVVVGSVLVLFAAGGCRERQPNRALDPTNELPLGRADNPSEGQHLTRETSVGGWALDDRGIREIRVYIDGHLVNTGQVAVDRPDVSKAFPQYAHGTNLHGWSIPIRFPSAGAHKLLVQAVDTDDATRDIAVLDVTSDG
jgi:hypothetical protein